MLLFVIHILLLRVDRWQYVKIFAENKRIRINEMILRKFHACEIQKRHIVSTQRYIARFLSVHDYYYLHIQFTLTRTAYMPKHTSIIMLLFPNTFLLHNEWVCDWCCACAPWNKVNFLFIPFAYLGLLMRNLKLLKGIHYTTNALFISKTVLLSKINQIIFIQLFYKWIAYHNKLDWHWEQKPGTRIS